MPWSDNLYDIGAPASRVRHLYVGSATIGTIVGGLPLHQATHQKGAADEIANVAWTNQQNTFTQQNTFAANPIFAASNVSLVYRDTASPANSQIFVMANSGGTLRFYSADDAYSLQATALVIDRAGNVTVGPLTVSAAGNASLAIVNTSRPVDGRRWNLLNFDGDGGLYFQTQTDAAGFISNVFSLQRAGKAAFSGQVQLPNINPVLLFGGNTNAFVALRCGTGAETNWLEVMSADGPPASVYSPVRARTSSPRRRAIISRT